MTENTEPLEPAEGSLRQARIAFFSVGIMTLCRHKTATQQN